MGRYLDMLAELTAKSEKPAMGHPQNQQNPAKGSIEGFEGAHSGTFQIFTDSRGDPAMPPDVSTAHDALVTPDDLHRVRRPLLAHLTHCRECIVDLHRYCRDIVSDANTYETHLLYFSDPESIHEDFVSLVIRARHAAFVRGLH